MLAVCIFCILAGRMFLSDLIKEHKERSEEKAKKFNNRSGHDQYL